MKFEELVEVKRWQNIQDILSAIIKISLRTVDQDGRIIVQPSNMPKICLDVIGSYPQAVKKCWQWFPNLVNHLKRQDDLKCSENICPMGLVNFSLPVRFDNAQNIYVIVGPLVFENSDIRAQLSSRIKEFAINEQKFFEHFDKLPAIKAFELKNIIEFLKWVASFIEQLNAFQQTCESKNFIFDKEAISALLKTFLELAMKLCEAEMGSVMVFEKKTQQLSIKDAKGLSKDIVDNTKVKPGEGIAGLTIEQKKAFFVNDELKDREVRLRMRRPKVKSAFVIPVFYKDEVLGVISIATAKYPNKFSDNLMELLNELVGLALEKIELE